MELADLETCPVAFCPECKKKTLISIETFRHEVSGLRVEMAYCPVCDTVLNLEEDLKIDWITEQEAELLGFFRAPELESNNLEISSMED